MANYIRHWVAFIAAFVRTRRRPLLAAYEAMYTLNRWAQPNRYSDMGHYIYKLKVDLIRLLYEQGHCTSAQMETQPQYCWGDGYGECDERCRKCGGTGIYRQHQLYAFDFVVNGRVFRWHQPVKLVNWPVRLHLGTGEYDSRWLHPDDPVREITPDAAEKLSYMVWWALHRHHRAPRQRLFEPLKPQVNLGRSGGVIYVPGLRVWWNRESFSLECPIVARRYYGYYRPQWSYLVYRNVGTRARVEGGHKLLVARLACVFQGHNFGLYRQGARCRRCGSQSPEPKSAQTRVGREI